VISEPVVREGLLGKPRETKIVDFLNDYSIPWNEIQKSVLAHFIKFHRLRNSGLNLFFSDFPELAGQFQGLALLCICTTMSS